MAPSYSAAPRSLRGCRWLCKVAVAACIGLAATVPVQAQITLPSLGTATGVLPGAAGAVRDRLGTVGSGLIGSSIERIPQQRVAAVVGDLRRRNIATLLGQHGDRLEADPAGEPIVRAELLLVSPGVALLDAAYALGYRLLREDVLEGLDLRSVVLKPPPGMTTAESLARLRLLDPRVEADFNHVYLRGGEVVDTARRTSAALPGVPVSAAPQVLPEAALRRIGLVDSGVDFDHPAVRGSARRLWGCQGRSVASPHGTAVASLLVGSDGAFRGLQTGATLYAADVYCGASPAGGSAEAVAEAMAWMAREQVSVINVSLVGAPNRLLHRAVQALHAKGHLVVAAVGNDGPTAPPLYPAAYPEVVGVTGTTRGRTVLPEAVQGPQVAFAAPGAELLVARSSTHDYVAARGTSFASPLIAAMLSTLLPVPDQARAHAALQQLAGRAADLGRPGRDPVYGHGLLEPTALLQWARN